MKHTGVIIARFQTPYLHEGHHQLISYVKERHNKVVIILGVTNIKASTRNPLDFYTRERMVKAGYPEIIVLPLADNKSDKLWSLSLDNLLRITFPSENFILYGSRDSFIPYYEGKNPVEEIPQTGDFSGSDLREEICDKVGISDDFRKGIIYAYYNTYPKVYSTVDIALFNETMDAVLLGRRKSEGKWRFPGGFTDPSDQNYEAAARRELHEECGNLEAGALKYEMSFRVDDWRYRNEKDKIFTILYSCKHIFGVPQGGDDLDEVSWLALSEFGEMLKSGEIVEEHIPHTNHILEKYYQKN
jgi:bifunctional NMN adenylyltransferase/nudix hydrolase